MSETQYLIDPEKQSKKLKGKTRLRHYCSFCRMTLCRPRSDYCSEACCEADAERCLTVSCNEVVAKGSVFCERCRDQIKINNLLIENSYYYPRMLEKYRNKYPGK